MLYVYWLPRLLLQTLQACLFLNNILVATIGHVPSIGGYNFSDVLVSGGCRNMTESRLGLALLIEIAEVG